MYDRKNNAELSVIEAVDNLSHMAEIDLAVPDESQKPLELTEEQMSDRLHSLSWHHPGYDAYNRERVKETFRAILKYMQELYEKEKGQLKEEETQRGIQAMMVLANEAAQKIDNHTDIFKPESVTALKEYKDLQHFYLNKISQKFQKVVEFEAPWQEEWGVGVDEDKIGLQRGGVQNLESIRQDKEYELFAIRNENGHPFFNRSLLHHIQLIGQFDFMLRDVMRNNPFLRIPMIQDRDAHLVAKEIVHFAASYIESFFKEALKFKQMGFVAAISKAVMALMLAANPRNLMQTAIGKSALHYYTDFHAYLRSALATQEYHRFLKNPPELSERFLHALINLSHVLAASFFLRTMESKDMIAFIHALIEKGARGSDTQSSSSFWNTVLDQDDHLRRFLKQTLNGPLMMTLRLFSQDKQLRGFDPVSFSSPGQLYTMVGDDLHVSCLRLPSPTMQTSIDKATIVDEFYAFLRYIVSPKRNQRHLLINLQDRTSWYERARCNVLEALAKKDEFASALTVVTLPKNVDFYLQRASYLDQNDAKEFKREFRDQIASAEECGFFFPSELDLKTFTAEALDAIHRIFFGNKDTLVHKNRLDFIEIFYMLLTLKLIEIIKPDTLSFTCKDGIDIGAAASAGLFAFLRMMNDPSPWSKEEKDFLLWMLYAPALSVRERAIDEQRFDRLINALSLVSAELEAKPRETVSALAKLFQTPFFKGLTIKEPQ